MIKGQKVAYVRVSTLEQNVESQLQGISVDKTFVEKASAKNKERPILKEMLNYVREGDRIFVHRIDRLARNVKDLLAIVEAINTLEVSIHFISENLLFDGNQNPMSQLMLTLSATFSEFERNIARERQREGIINAKKKGLYKGRKPIFSVEESKRIHYMIHELGMSKGKVAREYGVSVPTIYAYLRGKSKPLEVK
jgi:DNA invertase Pin-like site-specific DNA recombinase